MSRLKLEFPEPVQFQTELDVRISDINYGQHLGNDAVLALVHEARLRFLATYGWSEQNTAGAALIMLDAAIVYRAQARWGDKLIGHVAVGELRTCDFDLYYRLVRKSDATEIAVAKTGLAFYDYGKNRVMCMPHLFREKMSKI